MLFVNRVPISSPLAGARKLQDLNKNVEVTDQRKELRYAL